MDDVKPFTKQIVLNVGDVIILCSDGISDAFREEENLKNFVNNLQGGNPQEIANQIVERAKTLSNGIAQDDMTVIVARIFNKL